MSTHNEQSDKNKKTAAKQPKSGGGGGSIGRRAASSGGGSGLGALLNMMEMMSGNNDETVYVGHVQDETPPHEGHQKIPGNDIVLGIQAEAYDVGPDTDLSVKYGGAFDYYLDRVRDEIDEIKVLQKPHDEHREEVETARVIAQQEEMRGVEMNNGRNILHGGGHNTKLEVAQKQKEKEEEHKKNFYLLLGILEAEQKFWQEQAYMYAAQSAALDKAILNVRAGRGPTDGMSDEQKQHFEDAVEKYKEKHGLTDKDIDLTDLDTLGAIHTLTVQNYDLMMENKAKAQASEIALVDSPTPETTRIVAQKIVERGDDHADETFSGLQAHVEKAKAIIEAQEGFDTNDQNKSMRALEGKGAFSNGFGNSGFGAKVLTADNLYGDTPDQPKTHVGQDKVSYASTLKGEGFEEPWSETSITAAFNDRASILVPEPAPKPGQHQPSIPEEDIQKQSELAMMTVPTLGFEMGGE